MSETKAKLEKLLAHVEAELNALKRKVERVGPGGIDWENIRDGIPLGFGDNNQCQVNKGCTLNDGCK